MNYTQYDNDDNMIPLVRYYNTLTKDIKASNLELRKSNLRLSEQTMDSRYKMLFQMKYNDTLYNSMVNDNQRKVITRWRLSSYKLFIETGRYKRPSVVRDSRVCIMCNILEDENHALFFCVAHQKIRL